jgi:hypothetical protein
MNRQQFHDQVYYSLAGQPQRQALADAAIKNIYAGLDDLAKLGRQFQLVPDEVIVEGPREFPKAMYHRDSADPGAIRTVENSLQEQEAVEQGWQTGQFPPRVFARDRAADDWRPRGDGRPPLSPEIVPPPPPAPRTAA